MSLKQKRGFLRLSDDEEKAVPTEMWDFPDYGDPTKPAKETALNYDPGWVPHIEQEPEEEPFVLTEEQIEIIKAGAYQEGLQQGQEAGLAQGFEQGKVEGFEQGKLEGQQVGHAEGVASGQEEIAEKVASLVKLSDQFAEPLQTLNAQVERQIVDMVLTLTREIVHVEVQTNPQCILEALKESVTALPVANREIKILLNPQDHKVVLDAYGNSELDQRQWQLVCEPALNVGDIQIEAGDSSVSFLVEERIRSVIKQFCSTNHHRGDQ
ncbi:flagellar assembly protein FliH [Vibrio sp. Of7-15]|uniref:flagellar assembly protein FliH n=1 Tax=Vibrio sp. Of7-15 TaxID=2724879 RepID=UPI001EF16F0D|nr:flagellar assembly protein FliH [Vibrio sp. Of7-15]MCG7499152.1 flagellar assembly protein FliH [Vibrio sp. Of7-15]